MAINNTGCSICTFRHTATKCFPLFLLYNMHHFLSIDIRYQLVELQEVEDKPYDLHIGSI